MSAGAWMRASLATERVEVWVCGRLLNPRGRLLVRVARGRRHRCDMRQATSAAKLREDGWRLSHVVDVEE